MKKLFYFGSAWYFVMFHLPGAKRGMAGRGHFPPWGAFSPQLTADPYSNHFPLSVKRTVIAEVYASVRYKI